MSTNRRHTTGPRVHRVVDDTAVFAVRASVRELSKPLGFPVLACEELVIVVSELTTNILKYGVKGSIMLSAVEDEERGAGLLILAEDETEPFDLEMGVLDGHDARGKLDPAAAFHRRGIGAGLGAVSRFSDELTMEKTATGKCLRVVRYVKRPRRT